MGQRKAYQVRIPAAVATTPNPGMKGSDPEKNSGVTLPKVIVLVAILPTLLKQVETGITLAMASLPILARMPASRGIGT